MISSYRVQHGEGRVVMDSTLTRIAHEQAGAMAAKDKLDHDVLGGFTSRVHSAGAGRAAENIAYGYDSFPKTLRQWIDSAGHRRNLLMHGASRVGVASVKSATTGRTYWAMEIAGDYERPRVDDRNEASSRCKAKSPHKGNLPLEDSEYLPLMQGLSPLPLFPTFPSCRGVAQPCRSPVTRQITSPTSSATRSEPRDRV